MNDWFRSIGIFGTAFVAVIVFTMGAAMAIVPSGDGARQPTASPSLAPGATPAPTTAAQQATVGGTLAVTGDRDGVLVLERETTENRYGLVGPEGRILFEGGDPVTVNRVQYDRLEFFVEPDDCTVVPGERHDPTGIVGADIRCESIEDVRGNGTIGLSGRVGVAATLFGLRGDLPVSGGSLTIGDETLQVGETRFVIPTGGSFFGTIFFAGQIVAEEGGATVWFDYSAQTHELSVGEVMYGGESTRVTEGCSVDQREIGVLDPHTRVVEVTLHCPGIELPNLGEMPLSGSVVVDMVEPPR